MQHVTFPCNAVRFKIIPYQHANCASVIFTDYTSPRRDTVDLQIHRHAIRSITYEM